MLRVAFLLNLSKGWLGGINYYRNLLIAITRYSKIIKPVLFVPSDMDMSCLEGFPDVEIHRTCLFKRWTPVWLLSRVSKSLFGVDCMMAVLLRYYKIRIISHDSLGNRCPGIKLFSWIPDFQHKYLTDFFSAQEIEKRDYAFQRLAAYSDKVILSSYAAKSDFDKFYPEYSTKSVVLQFVPDLDLDVNANCKSVLDKYNLPKKFFFLPNQYWIHKNHKIVLHALKILKAAGMHDIVVVSTGNTSDYRAKGYFEEIRRYIEDNELGDNYKILGLIPYEDVQALAYLSVAYMNPSLFEGWSTVVEEAKYRGKRIILSDIGVHIEQAPAYGYYFSPHDVDALAKLMIHVWDEKFEDMDKEVLEQILNEKQKKFAACYEQICL